MKKLFLVFAVAAFAVACNDSATSTETNADSTTIQTPAPAPTVDTVSTPTADTNHVAPVDSTKK